MLNGFALLVIITQVSGIFPWGPGFRQEGDFFASKTTYCGSHTTADSCDLKVAWVPGELRVVVCMIYGPQYKHAFTPIYVSAQ